MAVVQCNYCNRLFNSVGIAKVCPVCRTMLDDEFLKIRSFLYKNPEETNMVIVSESLDIPEKVISYLIGEGKLEFGGSGGKMRCKVCGSPCAGVLCSKCRDSFASETKNLSAELGEANKKQSQNKEDEYVQGIKFHYKRK
jgi:hypothetical protein